MGSTALQLQYLTKNDSELGKAESTVSDNGPGCRVSEAAGLSSMRTSICIDLKSPALPIILLIRQDLPYKV